MTADQVPNWPGAPTEPPDETAPLRIDIERLAGGTVLVRVSGEVDHDGAPQLRDALCGPAIADRPGRCAPIWPRCR